MAKVQADVGGLSTNQKRITVFRWSKSDQRVGSEAFKFSQVESGGIRGWVLEMSRVGSGDADQIRPSRSHLAREKVRKKEPSLGNIAPQVNRIRGRNERTIDPSIHRYGWVCLSFVLLSYARC